MLYQQLAITLILLTVGYFSGRYFERRHFRNLGAREQRYRAHHCSTLQHPPEGLAILDVQLVTGSVVVSLDYFKRFVAGLRGLIGGRVKSYEPLMQRARREAVLRMREQAMQRGLDLVVNVRLDTSRLASAGPNANATAGIEVLAYGTAMKSAAVRSDRLIETAIDPLAQPRP